MPKAQTPSLIQTRRNRGHERPRLSESDPKAPSLAPALGTPVQDGSDEGRTMRQVERPTKESRYTVWRAFADVVTGFQKAGRHGFALTALLAILASIVLVVLVASGAVPTPAPGVVALSDRARGAEAVKVSSSPSAAVHSGEYSRW